MTHKFLVSLISSKGMQPTPSRLAILAACIKETIPLDVQDVAHKVGHEVHLATVYRTLEKFVSVGILEKLDFQEGKFRYEFMHTHHHHAICENCGKVEDVVDTTIEIKALEHRLSSQSGFTVSKHILELFGICNKCHKKDIYEK